MASFDAAAHYRKIVDENPDVASGVAAIQTLVFVVKKTKAKTMMHLAEDLQQASDRMIDSNPDSISIKSGCDFFRNHVDKVSMDISFDVLIKKIVDLGVKFEDLSEKTRTKIAHITERFIEHNSTVLTLGYSRVVCECLIYAAEKGVNCTVYVSESRPRNNGYKTVEVLSKAGIPVTLVPDSAIGFIINRIDSVLVGAEAVCANGGIISQVGTYQTAVIAKALNRPFNVAVETFKFTQRFPQLQKNVPQHDSPLVPPPEVKLDTDSELVEVLSPALDYTDPKYVTHLYTDLGVKNTASAADYIISTYSNPNMPLTRPISASRPKKSPGRRR